MSQFKQPYVVSRITHPNLLAYASMPPAGEPGQEQSTPPASYGYPPIASQEPQPQMTPPPGMMPPRKRTGRKWAIGCGAVILVLIIIGIIAAAVSAGSRNSTATTSSTVQPTDTPTQDANAGGPAPSATVAGACGSKCGTSNSQSGYGLGQTVSTADGFDITINKVSTSQGNDYETPPQGDQYLIVDVSTKNMTAQVQDMNALDFTLTDSTGQQMNWTVASGLPDMHPYPLGALQPGATSRGALVYEVPIGSHPYTLAFALDQFSGTQTVWDIHS